MIDNEEERLRKADEASKRHSIEGKTIIAFTIILTFASAAGMIDWKTFCLIALLSVSAYIYSLRKLFVSLSNIGMISSYGKQKKGKN